MLDAAREHHEQHQANAQRKEDGRTEVTQIVTDVEHEGYCQQGTHQDGEQERETVAPVLLPQGLELLAAILLHDHCTEERRDEENGEQTRDGITHPLELAPRGQVLHEGQHEGKHDEDNGHGQNGIDQRVERHGYQQVLPLVGSAGLRLAEGEIVKHTNEARGQMALKGCRSRHGETNHVRGEERGDDRHGHHYGIEEIADDT